MNITAENITSSEDLSTNLTSKLWSFKEYVFCINLLVGLPTHSYILWIIITGRGIASEFYNFNVTVCEMIYSLYCLAYILLENFPSLDMLQWVLQALVMIVRALFQSLMCVDRYLAVVHPVTFLKFKPLRYRVIFCTVIWIIGLISLLGRVVAFMLSEKNLYIWTFSSIFLVLLSVQLFCLSTVLRALKQSGPGERGREREEENHMKRRAFYIILITTVNMVIMFVPYIVTGFHFVLTLQEVSSGWSVSVSCFILSGYVQPLLYLHRVGKLFCFCSP